ncbi:hypothetical protein [Kovacikia minuta]|nr:hypothetical protein [Kovacikia minuta]
MSEAPDSKEKSPLAKPVEKSGIWDHAIAPFSLPAIALYSQ